MSMGAVKSTCSERAGMSTSIVQGLPGDSTAGMVPYIVAGCSHFFTLLAAWFHWYCVLAARRMAPLARGPLTQLAVKDRYWGGGGGQAGPSALERQRPLPVRANGCPHGTFTSRQLHWN